MHTETHILLSGTDDEAPDNQILKENYKRQKQ